MDSNLFVRGEGRTNDGPLDPSFWCKASLASIFRNTSNACPILVYIERTKITRWPESHSIRLSQRLPRMVARR